MSCPASRNVMMLRVRLRMAGMSMPSSAESGADGGGWGLAGRRWQHRLPACDRSRHLSRLLSMHDEQLPGKPHLQAAVARLQTIHTPHRFVQPTYHSRHNYWRHTARWCLQSTTPRRLQARLELPGAAAAGMARTHATLPLLLLGIERHGSDLRRVHQANRRSEEAI